MEIAAIVTGESGIEDPLPFAAGEPYQETDVFDGLGCAARPEAK